MPKLEVYTMVVHFQNEITPIYSYIEYLNSFWQQQLFTLSKVITTTLTVILLIIFLDLSAQTRQQKMWRSCQLTSTTT